MHEYKKHALDAVVSGLRLHGLYKQHLLNLQAACLPVILYDRG
jgi:hypothetical protein